VQGLTPETWEKIHADLDSATGVAALVKAAGLLAITLAKRG